MNILFRLSRYIPSRHWRE